MPEPAPPRRFRVAAVKLDRAAPLLDPKHPPGGRARQVIVGNGLDSVHEDGAKSESRLNQAQSCTGQVASHLDRAERARPSRNNAMQNAGRSQRH